MLFIYVYRGILLTFSFPTLFQTFPFHVSDVTKEKETGEFIATRITEVIGRLEMEYGVKVLAITADAASNCRKGRRLASVM